jgi:hypothetical protein
MYYGCGRRCTVVQVAPDGTLIEAKSDEAQLAAWLSNLTLKAAPLSCWTWTAVAAVSPLKLHNAPSRMHAGTWFHPCGGETGGGRGCLLGE